MESTRKKLKNQITIHGTSYVIDEGFWASIEWRKVLKEITEKAYWNYQGRVQLEKMTGKDASSESEAMLAQEDIPAVTQQDGESVGKS
ncbi:MAG: hypothetical protein K5683_00110 [Prevotella sp.]|nr:hypothetical protein [Prevotella sp.]